MSSEQVEPVATPTFTMIGSETTVVCDGDSCGIVVDTDDALDN